jgi:hypothetical protein
VRWAKAAHVLLRYYTISVLFITQITWSQAICDALRMCVMPACGRWYFQSASLQIIIGLQQYLMASRGEYSVTTCGKPLLTCAWSIVYALYGGARRIRWLLILGFTAEHLVMAICTALTVHGTKFAALCEPVYIPPIGAGIGYARPLCAAGVPR